MGIDGNLWHSIWEFLRDVMGIDGNLWHSMGIFKGFYRGNYRNLWDMIFLKWGYIYPTDSL